MRFTKSLKSCEGQNLVEYILLFVIVVACSVTLARSVPSIFSGFVDKCSSAMTGASSVGPSHSGSPAAGKPADYSNKHAWQGIGDAQ